MAECSATGTNTSAGLFLLHTTLIYQSAEFLLIRHKSNSLKCRIKISGRLEWPGEGERWLPFSQGLGLYVNNVLSAREVLSLACI